MNSLVEWLAADPERCQHGYHRTAQECPDCRKAEGIARATDAADPDLRAMVDEEIRRAAASGETFSSNSIRSHLPHDVGPLMGARFNAAAKAGLIAHVGFEKSTKGSTNSHHVMTWRGVAA